MGDKVTPDDWTPAVWSHAAVMDMQARLDPVRMTRYADDWQRAVDEIRDVLVDLNRHISGQLDRSWRGRGADASIEALQRYVAGSLAGLPACRSVAVHLSELSRAAGDLRASITPPTGGEYASEGLNEALAQVRQLYSTPAVAAGNAVEEIPAPPDPFEIEAPSATLSLPTANPPAAVQPQGLSSAPIDPTPSAAGLSDDTVSQPNVPLPAAQPDPPWRAPTHSSAVSPSLADPLTPQAPATTPHPAGVPSGVPGHSPSVTARGLPSPVTPFLGGMYPGYMGRNDGGEHRSPPYLISAGNSNELIGELPLVAPPVIGE